MHRRPTLTTLIAAGSVTAVVACVPAVGPVGAGPSAAASPAAPSPASPAATASPIVTGPETVALPPVTSSGNQSTMPVSGRVFDESGVGVPAATVTATVRGTDRFANGSDILTTTSVATGASVGLYTLPGCPTGTIVTVTASKPGWTTRTRVHVPVSLVGPGANVLDFGGTAQPDFALSDAPEVTRVGVTGDATGVDPATAITLRFSEPVEAAGVEQGFAIYAAGPSTTGDASVWRFASNGGLPVGYDTPSDKVTAPDKPIWDLRAFQATWKDSGQELFLQFKPGYRLPADRLAQVGYAIVLRQAVADTGGRSRSGQLFHVKADGAHTTGYDFTTMTDRTNPRIVSVAATDVGSEKAPAMPKDRIRITLSKPIVYQPLSLTDGATYLPDITNTRSAMYPGNYRYIASAAFPEVFPLQANPYIGVVLTEGNTVLEVAPDGDSDFSRSNTVYVQIGGNVTDPAGNPIDTAGAGNIGSAVVR